MKLLFNLIAVSLASAGWALAQPFNNAPTNGIGPRITFNAENYDFVKILAGDTVKYTFLVTNTGDATLDINSAKGNCSCTVVGKASDHGQWIPQHLAPGQSCELPVEIATASYAGQNITKMVIVASNDRTRPMVNLQIHGAVWEPVQLTPSVAVFNLSANATNATQAIKIVNHTDAPLVLSEPVCNTNAFTFSLVTNVPGQEFQLTVNAAPPSLWPLAAGVRTVQGLISMKTSVPLRNPLNISVYETIMPEVRIFPETIQLPPGPLAQASTNRIIVRDDSTNITLSNPSANVPGVETSIVTILTNRQYYLNAVFPKGFDVPVGQAIALTVHTDNPRFPILTVPVAAMRALVPNRPQFPPAKTAVLPASIRTNAGAGR